MSIQFPKSPRNAEASVLNLPVGQSMWILLLVMAVLLPLNACSADKSDLEATRKQIAIDFLLGEYSGDLAVVDRLAAPEIVVSYPVFEEIFGSASIRGRQAVRDFAAGFAKRWIDRELTIYQVVAQGDTVVVVWGFRARRAGSDSPDDTSKAESAWGGVTLFRFNSKDQIAFEIGEESSPGPSGRVPSAFRELVAR